MGLDVVSSWIGVPVPRGGSPSSFEALADIILFAPPVVAADTGPPVSFMHALASPPDGVYAKATEPAGV
jgi:hypothetical protein